MNRNYSASSSDADDMQQLKLAYHMATDMAKFKQGFLGRISHELRSPLNGLIGMHQLILNDLCDSPEEEREFIAKAHDSALKLIKLIDEMVIISKTEQGTDVMEIETIPLTEVFQDIYDLTYLQAANRNLHLDIVMPDPEIYVQADLRRLRQVLTSLVDSAISHMSEGSIHLHADAVPETQQVYLYLEDQRSPDCWQEPIDLLNTPPSPELDWNGSPSPGLTLMANQLLLELMNGSLELLQVPSPEASAQTSRILCKLPWGSVETEEPSAVIQD
ncbi:sensor histidine kinase [Roseofilum capinflatum]|uniref:histidine kinase n=1 Tax=Roseofilum capinflatum BLCC-M114 TaxID=3022440 RepID=A0ABT7B1Q2_9CYAN|nr:HAMP domain-containing sensor histidine kinase [Roseofilum capinflatum]MDJ1172476.1 HAMP domain-containing sensor histidine kinase [Roseofilum capinflatum BLCC-M114]